VGDIERDHQLTLLTHDKYSVRWYCKCGATGQGLGRPIVGWAEHLALTAVDIKDRHMNDEQPRSQFKKAVGMGAVTMQCKGCGDVVTTKDQDTKEECRCGRTRVNGYMISMSENNLRQPWP
jgi:hypothetical protein